MPYTKKLNEFKEQANMTNHDISERSGVPLGTVNRIMAGQTENPSFEAIAAMVRAMGGSLDELAGIPHHSHHKNHTNESDERIVAIYEKQLDNIGAIHEKRINDKNLWIKMLFAIVALLIVGFAALFIYDFSHPDRGWYIAEELRRTYALWS